MGRAQIAMVVLLASGCRFGFEPASDRDAGGDDAAQTDGIGQDTTSLDGTSAACASANVCDGFESAAIDTAVWTLGQSGGTITLDTTVAHRGTRSIKAHTDARTINQSGYAILTESQTFTATPPTLWVRGWFRIGGLPATNNGMELIFLGQTQQPQEGDYVFMHADDLGLYDQFDGTILSNNTTPPLNTWFCVVFEVTFATTSTGTMNMTSDSQPGIMMNNVVTQSSPLIDQLQIGIGYASGNVNVMQPAMDMWIDDVLVSGSALTCAD